MSGSSRQRLLASQTKNQRFPGFRVLSEPRSRSARLLVLQPTGGAPVLIGNEGVTSAATRTSAPPCLRSRYRRHGSGPSKRSSHQLDAGAAIVAAARGTKRATHTPLAANACANTNAGLAARDATDPVFARSTTRPGRARFRFHREAPAPLRSAQKGGRRERRRDARRSAAKEVSAGPADHPCCRILTAVRRWRIGRAALLGLVHATMPSRASCALACVAKYRAGSTAACGRSWATAAAHVWSR